MSSTTTGGTPPYSYEWSLTWLNQATSVRGYPADERVELVLPDRFGGGLFPIDLVVVDRDQQSDRAGADRQPTG